MMASFFFNWHGLERKRLSHLRVRMIAALLLICALTMFFINKLSDAPAAILTVVTVPVFVMGSLAIVSSFTLAKWVLSLSVLLIEYVVLATTGSFTLAPVFILLDAVLAWLLFSKERDL